MKTPEASAAPCTRVDLPAPSMPRGLQWIGVRGPGVIVPGMSGLAISAVLVSAVGAAAGPWQGPLIAC